MCVRVSFSIDPQLSYQIISGDDWLMIVRISESFKK